MSNIQQLIEMLQSNNPNKRYDACEELRVLPWLPEEAIDALRSAISDTDPNVAGAAQRALALHTSNKYTFQSNRSGDTAPHTISRTSLFSSTLAGAVGGVLFLIFFAILFHVFTWDDNYGQWDWMGIYRFIILLSSPMILSPLAFILLRALTGGVFGYITGFILRHRKPFTVIIASFIAGLIGGGIVFICVSSVIFP